MFQALLTSFTNETVKRIKPCSFKDAHIATFYRRNIFMRILLAQNGMQ